MVIIVEEAGRTSLCMQRVPDEARLITHAQTLIKYGHPLDVARDLDLLDLFVAGLALVKFIAEYLPLHRHTKAGEGAMPHLAGCYALAALCFSQLEELSLSAVQGSQGVESDMAISPRNDGNELLLWDQLHLMNFLVVPDSDNLCNERPKEKLNFKLISTNKSVKNIFFLALQ